MFEDPRERAQAIGVFAAMFGISMALGPVLGGVLVSALSWRAVFLVTVPAGPAAIALGYVSTTRRARASAQRTAERLTRAEADASPRPRARAARRRRRA